MRDGRRPTLSLERGTTTQGGLVTGGKIAGPQIVKSIFSFFPNSFETVETFSDLSAISCDPAGMAWVGAAYVCATGKVQGCCLVRLVSTSSGG